MNFKTIFSIGLCSGFLLVGCSDPERETITKMKAHLTGKSPEFRNVDGDCGEISYVDSSGKRSQYKHFIASDDIGIQIEGVEIPSIFEYSWSKRSKGNYISPTNKAAFDKCAAVVKTYASRPSTLEYDANESTNFSNDSGRQVVTLDYFIRNSSDEKIYHKAECVISPVGVTTMTLMIE